MKSKIVSIKNGKRKLYSEQITQRCLPKEVKQQTFNLYLTFLESMKNKKTEIFYTQIIYRRQQLEN